MNVYWIDENQKSLPNSAICGLMSSEMGGVTIIPKKATAALLPELRSLLASEQEALVILDYMLTGIGPDGKATKTEWGSNWSVAIRSTSPQVACVGITSRTLGSVPHLAQEQFLAFFERDNVLKGMHYNDLSAISKGYNSLFAIYSSMANNAAKWASHEKVIDEILGLLKTPANSRDLVKIVLPEVILRRWDDQTAHQVSRWVWHTFLRRPGFLADKLETATLLGLTESGFEKISGHFEAAKYTGIFSSLNSERWWISMLSPGASELLGKKLFGPIWKHRTELLVKAGVSGSTLLNKPFGRPDLARKVPAECVAFKDSSRTQRVAALEVDTRLDEQEHPPFGFEKNRIYSQAPSAKSAKR